ncbi:YitT family protein [uncultured Eubacterium sp.]|nr:YitT family protein [uncultured Eubacterium sp.]
MTTDEILKANQNQKYSYAHRAGIINAIGVTMFLAPVKLYDSGISGTSMLLGQLTPEWMSLFLAVLNIPIFLFGTKQEKN